MSTVNIFDQTAPAPVRVSTGGYVMRGYQSESTMKAVDYLKARHKKNGLLVLPGGAGKSIVIANIAKEMNAPGLIFQPSKELLAQNVEKYRSYGYKCGIYSASAGVKRFDDVTFATIGSVIRKKEKLDRFQYVLVDEAHLVGQEGMYADLIEHLGVKVIGLTATPYRLGRYTDFRTGMTQAILKFLNRTSPRIFTDIVHHVQNGYLFDNGYLCPLNYYEVNAYNRAALQANSTGADYTDESVRAEYERSQFYTKLIQVVNRAFTIGRKNCLVFTRFTKEAELVARNIQGCAVVTAETKPAERDRIVQGFKSGRIRCLANVGIFTTGFDHPALDTIVVARSMRSMALWSQMVYRCVRTAPGKENGMVVDMGGNLEQFGKVEDMVISEDGGWHIHSHGKVLTGVPFGDKFRAKR